MLTSTRRRNDFFRREGMKEVILCKDCKNFILINTTQYICDEFGGYVDKDDFCSRGEKCEGKRTDNGECVEFGNKERGETE